MGIMKRRMEAEMQDYNKEMRLCAVCGERIEYENDPDVKSYQYEYSLTGPFVTIWHCGCTPIIKGKCIKCGKRVNKEMELPICESCLEKYVEEIISTYSLLKCKMCGNSIPIEEIDFYYETGMCTYCDNMINK